MSPRKLIGVRDPLGLKPLCLGKRDNTYVLASESCALTSVGAEFIRDIEPGEMITISKNGIESNKELSFNEMTILKDYSREYTPFTIKELSNRYVISYQTARNYVGHLNELGYIKPVYKERKAVLYSVSDDKKLWGI